MTQRSRRFGLRVGAALAAAGMAVAVSAAPQPGPRPFGGRGMGMGGPRLGAGPFAALGRLGVALRRLDLSEQQMEQIRAIVGSHRDEMQEYRRNQVEARRAVANAQMALEPDATIRELHAKLAAVEADIAVAQAHVLAEVIEVLTPEQREALRAIQEQMPQRLPRPNQNRK